MVQNNSDGEGQFNLALAVERKTQMRKPAISQDTLIALGILVLTLAAYLQVMGFQFINFDDPLYVTSNSTIQGGLNWKSLRYAFTAGEDGSYLPLVWLSHAASVSIFGAWAGGHHLVNLLLHGANSVLLFYFFKRITKSVWPSAGVAFLFALHPLHVESVAWVSERKDVLSTLFWILTTWAYVRYVERPSARRYLGMTMLFVLGLLSKSMLVTLPLTLLLFDVWPLRRTSWAGLTDGVHRKTGWSLIIEKIPLLALSVGAAAATFRAARGIGAADGQAILPIYIRLGNAVMSMVEYLRQVFWPMNLSPFYSYPLVIHRWRIAGFLLFLLAISVACVFNLRRRPYLSVGWFWYLITLLPVAGIIQVGSQAHADRYTYIPLIGIFLMLSWLFEEFVIRWRLPRRVVLPLAGSFLGAMFTLTAAQTVVWRDSETLWNHALSLDPNNFVAQHQLGNLYFKEKRFQEACAAYSKANKHLQSYTLFIKLGDTYEAMGSSDQALDSYWSAQGPHFESGILWTTHPLIVDQRIGSALTRLGRYDEAEPYVQKALYPSGLNVRRLDPVDVQVARIDWAIILRSRNRLPEALQTLEAVVSVAPGSIKARIELVLTLGKMGRHEEAIRQMDMVSDLNHNNPQMLYLLGAALVQLDMFIEARHAFDRLKEVDPQSALVQKGILELERAQSLPTQRGSQERAHGRHS